MRVFEPLADGDAGGPVVLLSTASSSEEATRIARALVEERLAACCNLVPAVRSIYRWEERVEESEEVLIVIKSMSARVDRIRQRLVELHSYAMPELVVLPVIDGLDTYLRWMEENANGG